MASFARGTEGLDPASQTGAPGRAVAPSASGAVTGPGRRTLPGGARGPDSRAGLIGGLTAAMGLAVMPTFAVGLLAPYLVADLGISRAGVGALVALSSGAAAGLAPAAGRLVDRVRDRTALLVVLAAGAAGLAGMAAAPSAATMGLALVLGAICRAGSNPATNRVIAVRLPPEARGWVVGVKQAGETLAVVVAAGVLPTAALVVGWRGALLILSGLAACAVLAVWRAVEPGSARRAAASGARSVRVAPSVLWLAAYSVAMGAGGGCLIAYLPLFAHEAAGVGVAAAGALMVAAGVVATVCRVAWTRLAGSRVPPADALMHLATLAALSGAVLMAAAWAGAAAAWAGAALWGASGLGFGSVCMLAVMAESDETNLGRGTGLVVLGFGLGSTLTPPVFGWLVDRTDDYLPGLGLVVASYAVAAGVMLAGRARFGRNAEH